MFRGSFVSRRPTEIIEEAQWLAAEGVSELFLVSENTTSYGKDFKDMKVLENMLPEIAKIPGVGRIRLSYLQPAEMRPSLIQAMVWFQKLCHILIYLFNMQVQQFCAECVASAIPNLSYI